MLTEEELDEVLEWYGKREPMNEKERMLEKFLQDYLKENNIELESEESLYTKSWEDDEFESICTDSEDE